jgi:COP9 signalosome complex subunit 3
MSSHPCDVLTIPPGQSRYCAAIQPAHALCARPHAPHDDPPTLPHRAPPAAARCLPANPPHRQACVSSQHYTAALPVINTPISTISLALSPDLTYNDHLVYHYTAGVAAAALRKWELAEDLLETCASAPVGRGSGGGGGGGSSFGPAGPVPMMGGGGGGGSGPGMMMNMNPSMGMGMAMRAGPRGGGGGEPAALQADAMKKLVLVQLIQHGAPRAPPKYTHGAVARVGAQGAPYGALARAYPGQTAALQQVLDKEQATFTAVRARFAACVVRLA